MIEKPLKNHHKSTPQMITLLLTFAQLRHQAENVCITGKGFVMTP